MKKALDWILKSGLWIPLIIIGGCFLYFFLTGNDWIAEKGHRGLIYAAGFLAWILIVMGNAGKPNSKKALQGKESALHPPVDKRLLKNKPKGIVLGKDRKTGRYVCAEILKGVCTHLWIIGGSGVGKTTCYILNILLSRILNKDKDTTFFCVDLKGELHEKGAYGDDPNAIVIDPQDRDSWGYNPFYQLVDDSTEQEVFDVVRDIVSSMIPLTGNAETDFWRDNARNLIIGLTVYFYHIKGTHNWINIVDAILSKPMADLITEAMDDLGPNTVSYKKLVSVKNCEAETMSGIELEATRHLSEFATDSNIRYMFRENQNKANPAMLLHGKSIFLAINETKFQIYREIILMIVSQVLKEMERKTEDDPPTVIIWDEFARSIEEGCPAAVRSAFQTLRSRNVTMVMAIQSIEGALGSNALRKEQLEDMLANSPYIAVLDAKTEMTRKFVMDICGKYIRTQRSWSGSGTKMNITTAFDEKDLIDGADLMRLSDRKEALIMTPYGSVFNVVSKCPYYQDKYLSAIAMDIKKHNSNLITTEEETEENNDEQ